MLILKVSQLSGKLNSMELNVTESQMDRFHNRIENGEYVQTIFPNLTSEEREFLLSGITPTEWNETFK